MEVNTHKGFSVVDGRLWKEETVGTDRENKPRNALSCELFRLAVKDALLDPVL